MTDIKAKIKMIIFNTTFHLEDEIHDECLAYLRDEYIPQAIKDALLHDPRLALIHAQHEESGVSYSLQFRTKDVETLEVWMEGVGQELQKDMNARFGAKACGFMTLLEEIEL